MNRQKELVLNYKVLLRVKNFKVIKLFSTGNVDSIPYIKVFLFRKNQLPVEYLKVLPLIRFSTVLVQGNKKSCFSNSPKGF